MSTFDASFARGTPRLDNSPDPLPPFARDVLNLYATALPDVRFPDLDLVALETLAQGVREASDAVEHLEAALREAQELVAERAATLQARAERALSYARIYADGDASLSARVHAVGRNHAADNDLGAISKKRGRQRRATAPAEGLFGGVEASEAGNAAAAE